MKLFKTKKWLLPLFGTVLVGGTVAATAAACSSYQSQPQNSLSVVNGELYVKVQKNQKNWSEEKKNEFKKLGFKITLFSSENTTENDKPKVNKTTKIIAENAQPVLASELLASNHPDYDMYYFIKLPQWVKVSDKLVVVSNNAKLEGKTISLDVSKEVMANALPTEYWNDPKSFVNNQRWLANIWNTISAEKDAMSYNLYMAAIKQFDALKNQDVFELNKVSVNENNVTVSNTSSGKSVPVVFMDIDETVLNNYAFQNWLVLNNKSYNSKNWDAFVQDAVSVALPGAIEFIKHVYANGGVVMFNSNREQLNQVEPTIKNLVKEGLEAKYLPKWTFWMQGVDLENPKPWTAIKKDANGKRVKSHKESRMNLVNSKESWDLSEDGVSGNAVSFKTIMRVGDNFNDFNDLATDTTNEERNKVLHNDTMKLFGNFDVKTKGVKFTKNDKNELVKENTSWAESYVMIGGNASYGGFESGLAKGYYGLPAAKQLEAMKKAMEKLSWTPKKPL